ncbi:MAG: FxLYD domain-containing protein [Thermostichales cyanobacterium SZTDM-1c_bins_54]
MGKRLLALVCVVVSLLVSAYGRIPLELRDLHTVDCPETEEFSNVTVSGAASTIAKCFFVEGTVVNRGKQTLYNADVFGRIYDANGNDVLPERGRLGAIEEVPPGESPFAIRITVPPTNALPLRLEQFKATGFAGTVRR